MATPVGGDPNHSFKFNVYRVYLKSAKRFCSFKGFMTNVVGAGVVVLGGHRLFKDINKLPHTLNLSQDNFFSRTISKIVVLRFLHVNDTN